ncbi:hypothetical protein TUM17384_14510 [Shewanella algae]|uniref:TDP-N-acetylfucosamine:lipid II N-acetylfucosaminyltransferase n=1 Tax=Shewanella algae TaxID=38313 RepID=UPI001BF031F6|nr:TDP-N-acetylfucosamine:lipid II N-acetylfucosaminyltransferase [Shewanella algae]BCV57506.1 hypothetical protein TUM17384_14510 [Shewanella algae]
MGNSSTYSNNHIEAIDLLSEILDEQQVISPLGYGDGQYRQYVIDYGRKKLNKKFVPLVDYLPIDTYIGLLKSCGYVVMNHVRQQAVGNIIVMLYLGAKLFLRSDNVVYQFLKSNGAIIYSVEELVDNPTLLQSKINKEELFG